MNSTEREPRTLVAVQMAVDVSWESLDLAPLLIAVKACLSATERPAAELFPSPFMLLTPDKMCNLPLHSRAPWRTVQVECHKQ